MAVGTQVIPTHGSQQSNLDLKLIDETYGKNADLYEDVLRVPTTATQDEIQLAYFDRRSELFTLLAKIDAAARGPRSESSSSLASVDQQRYIAERKMDSVVFAVRILADPGLRKAYDVVRPVRTGVALIPQTPVGYTLQHSHSAATGSGAPISRSSSAASESSTIASNQGKKQPTPRAVTPPETPPEAPESKNWVQSTFSGSIFSSIGSSYSRTDDEENGIEGDEERNPRKSKRRQKQQQTSSTPNRERDAEPSSGEKEKKSIWGRKKRKKKRQSKDENGVIQLNESMDTNTTDTSMTDQEDAIYRNKNIDGSTPMLSTKSSASNTDYESSRGGGQRGHGRGEVVEAETADDDDTRRDDDTRTYLGTEDGETFATGSVTNPEDEELHGKAVCGCVSGSRFFKNIAKEVSGACEDTLVSVDQVFNAFTLTDKDIKAVTKKIHKAKRQLDN